jgi:hypothetical protein
MNPINNDITATPSTPEKVIYSKNVNEEIILFDS